jgi:3-deoxy-D-manno-octulosonic-acid transferase
MRILYNLSIRFYYFVARCLSLFNPKAKLWVSGRKNIFSKLSQTINPKEQIIWFHCASLGEFEQGRPLIEYIRKKQPQYKILLTFFSPSGYEVRKNYPGVDYVFYLPSDTESNARKFMEIVRPEYVFFIKYEFWLNYIHQAYLREIPFYSVSSIFSKKQIYFKWYGKWFRKQLQQITHFFTQNQSSVDLLKQYNIFQASVSGDTRFDRVYELSVNRKEIPLFSQLERYDKTIVAGSTWQEDEQLLAQAIKKHNFKLIIAPHEIDSGHIKYIESLFSDFRTICYSQISDNIQVDDIQVFIIDTIGILSSLYAYGKIAYIGGGFGVGIHNILEAATYGMPVIFGPNYKKFKEANDLIALSAAFPISNVKELDAVFNDLLGNEDNRKLASQNARQYVIDNIGACDRIYSFIFE